jgi:hypothetical protein
MTQANFQGCRGTHLAWVSLVVLICFVIFRVQHPAIRCEPKGAVNNAHSSECFVSQTNPYAQSSLGVPQASNLLVTSLPSQWDAIWGWTLWVHSERFPFVVFGIFGEIFEVYWQKFYPSLRTDFIGWRSPRIYEFHSHIDIPIVQDCGEGILRRGERYSCPQRFNLGVSLRFNGPKRPKGETHAGTADDDQKSREDVIGKGQFVGSTPGFVFLCVWVCVLSPIGGAFGGAIFACGYLDRNIKRQWSGGLLAIFGYMIFCTSLLSMVFDCLPWNWGSCLRNGEEQGEEYKPHREITVTQKLLTTPDYCNTLIAIGRLAMANTLNADITLRATPAMAAGIERNFGR